MNALYKCELFRIEQYNMKKDFPYVNWFDKSWSPIYRYTSRIRLTFFVNPKFLLQVLGLHIKRFFFLGNFLLQIPHQILNYTAFMCFTIPRDGRIPLVDGAVKNIVHIIWNKWGIFPAAPPVWIYVPLERFLWFILLRPLHTKQIEDNERKLQPTVSSCPFLWRTSTEHTVKSTGRTMAKQSKIWKGIPCGGR